MVKTKIFSNLKRRIITLSALMMLSNGLFAQTVFPGGDYWSFDAGFGMTDILVKGLSYQFIVDPKIWISPPLMVGSRIGVNYSTDKVFSIENQIYLRWNFLRPSSCSEKTVNIFVQGGVGVLASYKGDELLFSDATNSRGSFMLDAATGITIPLTSIWHIEPAVHGGYPHIIGFSITTGGKIPFRPDRTDRTDMIYRINKTDKTDGTNKAEQNKCVSSVKLIMFGADTGKYNAGINRDTQKQNELILNDVAKMLEKNPNYRVKIDGHANPVTNKPDEANRLMTLSKTRADTVAEQLKARGVKEKQIVITAFGCTKPVTSNKSSWNKNRRVELIVFQDTVK